MRFVFDCDDNKEYVVEASSFAEAKDRFATRIWHNGVPKIRSYRAYWLGGASVLSVSVVA